MGTPTLHFVYMELAATSVCIYTRIFVPCIAQLFIRAAQWKENPQSVGPIDYGTRVYMKMFKITWTERVYYTCV